MKRKIFSENVPEHLKRPRKTSSEKGKKDQAKKDQSAVNIVEETVAQKTQRMIKLSLADIIFRF